MTFIRALITRAAALFKRARREHDLNDEIQTHLTLLTEEHVKRGLSLPAARAAARRDFGGVTRVKEQYHNQLGFSFLDAVMRDVRQAVRQMRRSRSLAVI